MGNHTTLNVTPVVQEELIPRAAPGKGMGPGLASEGSYTPGLNDRFQNGLESQSSVLHWNYWKGDILFALILLSW